MKPMSKLALAGVAALAAIGLTGAAMAEIKHSHLLSIRLPDGSLEQIRYVGDTPPVVRLQPGRATVAGFWADEALGADPALAMLDRISALMDNEAAVLFQQARLLDGPDGLTPIDLGKLPPGVTGYSVVSTTSGGHTCTRTTQYGPLDVAGRVKSVTRIAGDCEGAAKPSPSTGQVVSAPRTADRPMLQRVSATY